MAKHFTDSDGDRYTVGLSASRENIVLTYQGESGGVELFIFKVEDATRFANDILNTALEAGK